MSSPSVPKIILATAGSLGDLHPFIALALALRDRGFQAKIAASPDYAAKVRTAGLHFHSVGPGLAELEDRLGLSAAELTRRVASSNTFLFEHILLPNLEDGARALTAVSGNAVAVIGSTFAAGAAIAAELVGASFVPVALQPAVVLSAHDPPWLPNAPWLGPADNGFRLRLNQATLAAARASTARWNRPVDRIRASFGLAPENRNLLLDGMAGRRLSLGLYSPVLAPRQPDAPSGFEVVGYAAYDSEDGRPPILSPQLNRFLASGPPPIVFTLGSAAVNIADDFYAESWKAARRLNRRAVLLVGPSGDLGVAEGHPDALALPYAPFSLLFPRAAAIVHQGGVGTTQQALRAGRPQLVIPHLGDQFDNAARVSRLGYGRSLARRRYTADRVATALSQILQDEPMARASAQVGRVMAKEDGAAVAAERCAALFS